MDTAKLNDWLTVVTNIGVIAGLVLLAYEISQTNEAIKLDSVALQAQTAANINAQWGTYLDWIVQDEGVTDIWVRGGAGESLNPIELARFQAISEQLFFAALNYHNTLRQRDPDSDLAMYILYANMRTRPGLRAQFDAWLDLYGFGDRPFERGIRQLEATQNQ